MTTIVLHDWIMNPRVNKNNPVVLDVLAWIGIAGTLTLVKSSSDMVTLTSNTFSLARKNLKKLIELFPNWIKTRQLQNYKFNCTLRNHIFSQLFNCGITSSLFSVGMPIFKPG